MADDIQQNYVFVDPVTGQTTIEFDNATFTNATITNASVTGLDIPAGTASTTPAADRIQWVRQSDGSVVADIGASNSANISILDLLAYQVDTGPGNESIVTVAAADDSGTAQSTLVVRQGVVTDIEARVAAIGKLILDDSGQSDYLQIGGAYLSATFGGTFTWPGGSSLATLQNPQLAGASGTVLGLIVCSGIGASGIAAVPAVAPDNAGGLLITAQSNNMAPVAGGNSCTFAGIMWGN